MSHFLKFFAVMIVIPFCCASIVLGQSTKGEKPKARIIKLDLKAKDYQRVLGGPPETSTMRSGLVTLAPGKDVGKHNTEKFEELVVILEGNGVMFLSGGDTLRLSVGDVAYCPRHTEHDVLNDGRDTLRYIYIVAETKK